MDAFYMNMKEAEMNIDKIITFGDRGTAELKEKGIQNPIEMKPGRYIVVEGSAAIVFDHTYPEGMETQKGGDKNYGVLTSDFHAKTADVAAFITTVGDLRDWLIKDTEACTFCQGVSPCPSPAIQAELTETTPEMEDAEALHYGWIGPVPINRAKLDELLDLPDASEDTKIILTTVMHERPHQNSPDQIVDFYGAVWVQGPDWELFLAGLSDKSGEAAPKFHLEGVFTKPTAKSAGKKVNKTAPPPKVKPEAKKAAPKKVVKPETKKAAPRKPVTPTKVVSKAPPKKTGSSLLDRALAKKAAGRKKK